MFSMVLVSAVLVGMLGSWNVKAETAQTTPANHLPKQDMMNVKVQAGYAESGFSDLSDKTIKKALRFVSSVDSTNYKQAGFEISYADASNQVQTKRFNVGTVYERIESTTNGMEYTFSPKVVGIPGEYFVTAKLTIPDSKADTRYTVRAYVKTYEDQFFYGPSRCFSYNDVEQMEDNSLLLSYEASAIRNVGDVISEVTSSVTGATYQAEVIGCSTYEAGNGIYKDALQTGTAANVVHVKIKGTGSTNLNAVTLPSVTTFTIDGNQVPFRNLNTSYTGTADTSWYTTDTSASNYVIATGADLYGLASLVNAGTQTFDGKNIYVVRDIPVNETEQGTAATWATTSPTYAWTPIGGNGNNEDVKRFKGTFDGQGHTISGLYVSNGNNWVGLFGWVEKVTLKNFAIEESYFKGNSQVGAVSGRIGGGTYENIQTRNIIANGTSGEVGGFTGRVQSNTTNITNCSVGGTVNSDTNQAGGFAGLVRDPSTLNVTGCNMTATVTATNSNAGGIAGMLGDGTKATDSTITVNIENCDIAGVVSSETQTGGVVGYLYCSTLDVTNTSVAGSVTGTETGAKGVHVGGVIGKIHNNANGADIVGCTISATVINEGQNTGGVIGTVDWGTARISETSVSGNITGKYQKAGGFVGWANCSNVDVSTCKTTANITMSQNQIGGVVGTVQAGDSTSKKTFTVTDVKIEGNLTNTVGGTGYRNLGGVAGLVTGNHGPVLNITDAFVAPKMSATGVTTEDNAKSYKVRALIGRIDGGTSTSAVANMDGVYRIQGDDYIPAAFIGLANPNNYASGVNWYGTNSTYKITNISDIQGNAATAKMSSVDFCAGPDDVTGETGAWSAVNGEFPELAVFSEGKDVLVVSHTDWFTEAASGVGDTPEDPYKIKYSGELLGFANIVLNSCKWSSSDNAFIQTGTYSDFSGKYVALDGDIIYNTNAPETREAWESITPTNTFKPIGTDNVANGGFKGTFDGKNHTIKGIYVSNAGYQHMGLFNHIASANTVIKNLSLENSYIKGKQQVGGIVGSGSGTFENVKSSAVVIAADTQWAGGIIGRAYKSGTMKAVNCEFSGEVYTNGDNAGGIAGTLASEAGGRIINCKVTGKVSGGKNSSGGIVGSYSGTATGGLTIAGCRVDATITGTGEYTGGVAGNVSKPMTILKTSIAGTVTGTSTKVGGFIGVINGSTHRIEECMTTATITTHAYDVGGVAGCMLAGSKVSASDLLIGGEIKVVGSGYHGDNTQARLGGLVGTLTNAHTDKPQFDVKDTLIIPKFTVDYDGYAKAFFGYAKGNNVADDTNATITDVYYLVDDNYISEARSALAGAWNYDNNGGVWYSDILTNHKITSVASLQGNTAANTLSQLTFCKDSTDKSSKWVTVNGAFPTLRFFANNETYVESTDTFASKTTIDQFAKVPLMATESGAFGSAYEYGNDFYSIDITGTNKTEYDTYLDKLTSNGFTKHSDNGTQGLSDYVYTSSFQKDGLVVTVSYINQAKDSGKAGTTTVSVTSRSELSEYLNPVTNPSESGAVTLSLMELNDNGNSFVIQLKNGNFVIEDGGNVADAPYLLDYLESLVPQGQKPVIEAWFITHAHDDHMGALKTIANSSEYRNRITVKGIYFVDQSATVVRDANKMNKTDNAENVLFAGMGSINNTVKAARSLNADFYRPTIGQKYYFDGVTIGIALTYDQILENVLSAPALNCALGNDTSTWLYHTFDGGKTFLHAGDAEQDAMETAEAYYGATYFKTDVYAVFHHGITIPYQVTFVNHAYGNDAVPYLLYTNRTKGSLYTSGWAVYAEQNNSLRAKADSIYAHGGGTVVLTFNGSDITVNTTIQSYDVTGWKYNNGRVYRTWTSESE